MFSQLLQLFPGTDFQEAVVATGAARATKEFGCWDRFVATLFCQLARAYSPQEICGGLASCEGKLVHLGAEAPARSSLAYANAHRPWQRYQHVFDQLRERCRALAPQKRFRFKHNLLSLDATVIDRCAEMFPWAAFRRTKGAVKLYFTLDHDGYLPVALVITGGKQHEVTVARQGPYLRFGWSLSNLVALLRLNLFVYRDVWVWINEPFTSPPRPPDPVQQGVLL